MKTMEEKAIEIARLMEDGKGNDVTLLDISGLIKRSRFYRLEKYIQ